jgi:tripartite-type tricarboxylate transporter receptor subunit TctC
MKVITLKNIVLSTLLLFTSVCFGQNYPNKPVTIIVTYAPGGLGDLLARQLAEQLTTKTKQSFIVENKPGATGALGSRFVSKAKPDGYTLLLGQTGEMVINTLVSKDLGYDPFQDLKPIALIGEVPLTLVAPPNAPYSTLPEFIKLAKSQPNKFTYASSGTATPGHLAGAALAQLTGIDMIHAPYKGAGPAMTDILGGHVDVFFSSTPSVIQFVEGNKVKALALSAPKRTHVFPALHTVTEDIGKDFSFTLWGGVFAPADTPENILQTLNTQINQILLDPQFKKQFEKDGINIRSNTKEEFAQFHRSELANYKKSLQSINLKLE